MITDCIEPFTDLRTPQLATLIHELLAEQSKPEVDHLACEQIQAQIYNIKRDRLIQATAASKRPMPPVLAAILRPTSLHLKLAS